MIVTEAVEVIVVEVEEVEVVAINNETIPIARMIITAGHTVKICLMVQKIVVVLL